MSTTAEVFGHHLEAVGAADFDAIMSDYADDAIVFTQNGVFRGTEEIKGFFSGMMPMLTPEFMETFSVDS